MSHTERLLARIDLRLSDWRKEKAQIDQVLRDIRARP